MSIKQENATFHAFKPSGKWKYTGRGYLSPEVFKLFRGEEQVTQILRDNDGKWPGMNSSADDLTLVVIGDDDIDHGFPLMIVREQWR